jgi:hypothetical protein
MLFLAGIAAQFTDGPTWLWWTLYLACYATGGWEPALAGLQALREKTLDVDLLMIVAAIGAAAIGQILDGGLLIVIFATSGALESLATQRTADSVRGLLDLAPEQATRLLLDGREDALDTACRSQSATSSLFAPVNASALTARWSRAPARSTRHPSPANRRRSLRPAGTRCSPAPSTGPALCGCA